MSTLGKSWARIAGRYAIAAVGCIAFNALYAQFAHGVSSPFMTFMFAIPLVAGAVPALVLHLLKAHPVPVSTRQAWALAIAALTVASCLHGIFDIAGTASPWLPVYLVAAVGFAAADVIAALRSRSVQR